MWVRLGEGESTPKDILKLAQGIKSDPLELRWKHQPPCVVFSKKEVEEVPFQKRRTAMNQTLSTQ